MRNTSLKLIQISLIVLIGINATNLNAQIAQFGGLNRNGVYNETGLLDKWPENGPELITTISGIGKGFGSPTITENGIYIAGMIDSLGYVFHFDHSYNLKWKTLVGVEFHFKYVGARATPTIEGNRLYYTAAMGDAVCLNATTGEIIWRLNILDAFNGSRIKWGYCESPLIYGEKIFYTPGGPHQNFVALNKMDGTLIWTSDIDSTYNSYCSPVIINHNNKDRILLNTSNYILLIDPADGKVVAKHPLHHRSENFALAPLYKDGKLFYSAGYGQGAVLFQIDEENAKLDTIYSTKELDCKISGMIMYEGTVFGVADRRKHWVGIDFESGDTVFVSRDFKPGSFIQADNKFYMFSDAGEVALAIPSKAGFSIVSRFHVPAEKVVLGFAHPVIYNGILFIRYNNDLWLYKVK